MRGVKGLQFMVMHNFLREIWIIFALQCVEPSYLVDMCTLPLTSTQISFTVCCILLITKNRLKLCSLWISWLSVSYIIGFILYISSLTGLFHLSLMFSWFIPVLAVSEFLSCFKLNITTSMFILHFVYSFICQWTLWLLSQFWILWIILLWTWVYRYLIRVLPCFEFFGVDIQKWSC